MKIAGKLFFLVLASGMALAQANPTSTSTVADDLKALREAIADQQKQIAQQQQQIETLKKALESKTSGTPHVENAALTTTAPENNTPVVQSDAEKQPKESPLSFRIGGTEFTPGGFVDFENVFRSTNAGGTPATGFGGIPFSNTVQGHLTEFRTTGQYSRYSLKITGKYGANNVLGYLEGDFNGNDGANVFVTSNPHTNRIRVYFVDVKRGKIEFMGGQSWGLLTPNRTGVSPMPADLALTLGVDANVHVGVNYTRAGTFRVVFHPNDKFAWAVGIENPQQFVGAGEVIFPFAFNAALGSQFDAANNPAAPNSVPDINTKLAYDSKLGGRHFHFELGGMATFKKITNVPIGGTTFVKHSKIGGAVEAALNYDLTSKIRAIGSGMWGRGTGRYLIGLAPDTVVVPIATSATTFDVDLSLVQSGNAIVGLELTPTSKTQFGAYYGGMYAKRNAFPDVTSPLVVKPTIGFGGTNSPNSANRAIQEASFDWTQTFWKNPQYGAILLTTQWSYLTRSPWFVAAGAPKNAHLGMAFASMRYVLP